MICKPGTGERWGSRTFGPRPVAMWASAALLHGIQAWWRGQRIQDTGACKGRKSFPVPM